MSFKCYDVAKMVIEDANERFSPIWKINNERLEVFQQYCEVIDALSEEFSGESYEVEVDEITMEVIVTLECEEIVISSFSHVFYELIKRAVKYGFSASEDGNLLLRFTFPSLWDK